MSEHEAVFAEMKLLRDKLETLCVALDATNEREANYLAAARAWKRIAEFMYGRARIAEGLSNA
jgi:hypothetical protein